MATTPNDLTRQQLDELDSLLQRMLSMPLNKPTPVVIPTTDLPAPPSGWRADAAAGTVPVPHMVTAPVRTVAATPVPTAGPAPTAFAPSALPLMQSYQSQPVELKPVPLEPSPSEVPFGKSEPVPSTQPESPVLSPFLWPLFALNWLIESFLKLFGPPGEMLTRPAAKGLLGASGLAMLVAAGLWVALGQGWIRMPIDEILNR